MYWIKALVWNSRIVTGSWMSLEGTITETFWQSIWGCKFELVSNNDNFKSQNFRQKWLISIPLCF